MMTNVAYKPSCREKVVPTRATFLKTQTGKASAAVAVKDLRPLRGARARASLTAILASAGKSPMGACPLPVFTKPESKGEEKIVFLFDLNHPLRK
jgi:hypothetical protein